MQVDYEGNKRYRDVNGVERTLADSRGEKIIPKEERSVYIDGLVPKTVYGFNISVNFIGGIWGPPVSLRVETSVDGVLIYFVVRKVIKVNNRLTIPVERI